MIVTGSESEAKNVNCNFFEDYEENTQEGLIIEASKTHDSVYRYADENCRS